jgi:hypothetical protein
MSEQNSVCKDIAVAKKNSIGSKYGKQYTIATVPVDSNSNLTNIQFLHTIESNPVDFEDHVYLQNHSIPKSEAPQVNSAMTSGQLPEAKNSPDKQEVNRSRSRAELQYLSVFLKFLEQQLVNQLPLFLIATLGLIFTFTSILISQGSEGLKVKLDLEISPKSNQVKKIP